LLLRKENKNKKHALVLQAPPANVRLSEWRKSAQWFALVRSHVGVVLNDRAVFKAFEDYCRSGWDQDLRRWRECYSDEHYMATLLHMNGLQEETVRVFVVKSFIVSIELLIVFCGGAAAYL
jgi:hypothetical protein